MTSIREVASRAGVSVATASRVLSQADYPVRASTRDRVLATAESLGYRPNTLARNLRHGSSSAVGVCTTALSNLTSMSAVEGITDFLDGLGRPAQVAMSRWDAARERAALDAFLEERVSGVLSFPTLSERDAYRRLQTAGIPTVLLNRPLAGVPAPVVRHDFASGYRRAVEVLASRGHRRIAALLASHTDDQSEYVLEGHGIAWSAALERVGLNPHPDWHLPAGHSLDVPRFRQLLTRMLNEPNPPTALFCGLVPATVTVLKVLSELDIRVPEDIAVVGTTDPQWHPLLPDDVPVVVLDSYTLGSTAAQLLDEHIVADRVTDDTEVIIGVDFDERTAPTPAQKA